MDYFRTVRIEFRNCFWTVFAEFLGLLSNSPGQNFKTVFELFQTEFGFGFDPETDVCGFCGVSCYPNNAVTNRRGIRGAMFYVGLKL